jgi:hypothetical protein
LRAKIAEQAQAQVLMPVLEAGVFPPSGNFAEPILLDHSS